MTELLLLFQLTELQVQNVEVQKLTQEQQNLQTKLHELETERAQAQNQAVRADTALGLAQAQHLRRLQELQERAGDGCREQLEQLQARLQEELRRSQQLEEALRLQAQQSSSQVSTKQVSSGQRSEVTLLRPLQGRLVHVSVCVVFRISTRRRCRACSRRRRSWRPN